jgi:hypothetical protein
LRGSTYALYAHQQWRVIEIRSAVFSMRLADMRLQPVTRSRIRVIVRAKCTFRRHLVRSRVMCDAITTVGAQATDALTHLGAPILCGLLGFGPRSHKVDVTRNRACAERGPQCRGARGVQQPALVGQRVRATGTIDGSRPTAALTLIRSSTMQEAMLLRLNPPSRKLRRLHGRASNREKYQTKAMILDRGGTWVHCSMVVS